MVGMVLKNLQFTQKNLAMHCLFFIIKYIVNVYIQDLTLSSYKVIHKNLYVIFDKYS